MYEKLCYRLPSCKRRSRIDEVAYELKGLVSSVRHLYVWVEDCTDVVRGNGNLRRHEVDRGTVYRREH